MGIFGNPWYHKKTDDEIRAEHPLGDEIVSGFGHHVSPSGHHYRLVDEGFSSISAHYVGKNGTARPQIVGRLSWFPGKPDPEKRKTNTNVGGGIIHKVFVKEAHRRRGVASAMLDFARQQHPDSDIIHSNALSEDGAAWADKKAARQPGQPMSFEAFTTERMRPVSQPLSFEAFMTKQAAGPDEGRTPIPGTEGADPYGRAWSREADALSEKAMKTGDPQDHKEAMQRHHFMDNYPGLSDERHQYHTRMADEHDWAWREGMQTPAKVRAYQRAADAAQQATSAASDSTSHREAARAHMAAGDLAYKAGMRPEHGVHFEAQNVHQRAANEARRQERQKSSSLQTVAHDSGDGETIYHCPFCGSGQVLARSDKTIECEFCFAGETEFITAEGIRTLKETVGTVQRVLVSQAAIDGRDFSEFGGRWVDAEIRSFGVQPLMAVTLKRAGEEKVIYATPEHRWLVTPMTNKGFRSGRRNIVLTQDLKAGSRLAPLFAQDRLHQGARHTVPSPFGIAHGFTFGDGSTDGRGGSKVTLWGDKDLALLPYFSASEMRHHENANGTKGIEVKHLPRFFKERPSLNESLSYLYGWLAGYFAADGSVSEAGCVQLYCADPSELDFVRAVATMLGIGTLGVRTYERQGFGDPSDLSRITFIGSTLTDDFFLVPEHKQRFQDKVQRREGSARKTQEHTAWKVVSVESTDRVEEVYCAVVPGWENFTLAENINVMNCHTCFTVQVQPQFSAFPQTINGVPVQVPGMPGQVGMDPSSGQPMPGGDPTADPNAPGVDADPDSAMADPSAPAPGEDPGDDGSDDSDEDDDKPAFLKGSALIEVDGHAMTPQQYLTRVAVRAAPDRRQAILDEHAHR